MSNALHLVPGYPKLADQQAKETQTSIYRSFSALNARLILYLQAELHRTELELLATEVEDHQASGDVRPFICKDWETMEESGLHQSMGDKAVYKQFGIIERVKVLLPRYYEALRNQRDICDFDEPSRANIANLQNFLASTNMGPRGSILCGLDSKIWGTMRDPHKHAKDLVSVVRTERQDPFSEWCLTKALDFFWRCGGKSIKKPDKTTGEVFWYEKQILNLTYYFTTTLVSLLLVSSITVLWVVTSMSSRLAIIATFNVVFSICLATFTTAPRSQVFAISASFAAVQVVFVGSNDPSTRLAFSTLCNATTTCPD